MKGTLFSHPFILHPSSFILPPSTMATPTATPVAPEEVVRGLLGAERVRRA